MSYEKFKERVYAHLGKCNSGKPGLWRGKCYPHILYVPDKKDKQKIIKKYNILENARELPVILHNFHTNANHLNSSQIMCYNYFRPLLDHEGKHPSKELIRRIGANFQIDASITEKAECCFEYEQKSQNWKWPDTTEKEENEGSHFDFYIHEGNIEIFFEIKYTEDHFRRSSSNSNNEGNFKKKYDELYHKKIQSCPALKEISFDTDFKKYYQIIRNVIRITDKNKYSVFLFPEDNTRISNLLKYFVDNYVTNEYKDHIKLIHWKDVVGKIEEDSGFTHKYLEY